MTQDQETKLDNLARDVDAIKRGLFGEPDFDQKGLVHEVTSLKAWQESMQRKVLMVSGGVVVLFFLLKEGLSGLWAWVSTLGKH